MDSLLSDVVHAPYPHPFRQDKTPQEAVDHALEEVEAIVEDPYGGLANPAGIVVEPIQGEGGIVTPRVISESPRADSHPALRDLVGQVARGIDGVERVVPTTEFGVSEDVTYLMNRVQDGGGLASYVLVGTDHPTSHHTPTFDIDEDSLEIGVSVLTETAVELSKRPV